MIILSIDSATPVAGVAVVDNNKVWAESFLNTGNTHSQQLLPLVKHTLESANLKLADIQGIAVSSGPGSFTGLRIGMATAKSIAQVTGQKLIGIPTLDALAYNLKGCSEVICPILNARKQEVYCAVYEMQGEEMQRISDFLAITPDALAEKLLLMDRKVTFLGDGVPEYSQLLSRLMGERAAWAPLHNLLPRAASLGFLGLKKLQEGFADDIFRLEPFYLRKSEAEVKWEAGKCVK